MPVCNALDWEFRGIERLLKHGVNNITGQL
jgi:hypothetical protein